MDRSRYVWVVVVFTLVGLLAIFPPLSVDAKKKGLRSVETEERLGLSAYEDIEIIIDLVLEQSGDKADVYFPAVKGRSDEFPVVSVLQGAGVDKSFYSGFGTQLARFGFVVVIPNHFVVFGPPGTPPVLFPDEFVILDVLAQMETEDEDPMSPLFRIVDTDRMGLSGHSAGGAASLFAIGRSCQPPFCIPSPPFFTFFPLPDAVRGGAFYGTNTIDPETGDPIPVDNNGIPVALVQGSRDGIATEREAEDTIEVIVGPSELIDIDKANHYGITDVNNPPGAVPDPNPQFISQQKSIIRIARESGEFLFEALMEGE